MVLPKILPERKSLEMEHPETYYHELKVSISRVIIELLNLHSVSGGTRGGYKEFSDFAMDTLKRFKDVIENSDYKEFFKDEPIFKILERDEK